MPRERITEIKTVDVDSVCKDNPVYLTWIDSTGGRNYWLFHRTYTIGKDIDEGETFNKFVSDIETARSNSEYLSKTSTPQWIIGADNVPTEKMKGLESLIEAPKVEILMNPDTWQNTVLDESTDPPTETIEGPKWQTVRVLPGSFRTREAAASHHSIELTIQFSERYLQTQ